MKAKYQEVKAAFLRHPGVLGATTSRFYLQDFSIQADLTFEGGAAHGRAFVFPVDEDFFEVFDIPILEGRNFPRAYGKKEETQRVRDGDPELFVVNQAAVDAFGLDQPIGVGMSWDGTRRRGPIIGVVKNFHTRTMHEQLGPVVFTTEQRQMKFVHLKVKTEGLDETLAHAETVWKTYLPNRPFEYTFLDERLKWYYDVEHKMESALEVFTSIAILVACLGLFGLASFSIEQRTREIGIRKALGSSPSELVTLMSREFVVLVLMANGVAWPVAYFAVSAWLNRFVYRIPVTLDLFLAGGAAAISIALVTVGYHAVSAARMDPVKALRYE